MYLRRIEYDSNYANKIFTLKFFETLRVHCILVFCIEKEALQREGPTCLVRCVGRGCIDLWLFNVWQATQPGHLVQCTIMVRTTRPFRNHSRYVEIPMSGATLGGVVWGELCSYPSFYCSYVFIIAFLLALCSAKFFDCNYWQLLPKKCQESCCSTMLKRQHYFVQVLFLTFSAGNFRYWIEFSHLILITMLCIFVVML